MTKRKDDIVDYDNVDEVMSKKQNPSFMREQFCTTIQAQHDGVPYGVTYDVGGYGTTADAKYGKTLYRFDQDNPLVAALPFPRLDAEALERKYTNLPEIDFSQFSNLDSDMMRICLPILKTLRVYLPFEKEMEIEFYRCLSETYHLRKFTYIVENGIKTPMFAGDTGDSANCGMTVLGYSGCGKSSSLKSLTSTYPQVLRHNIDGNEMTQILYIVVSCLPNSNFSSLYDGIGEAIDSALHIDVYRKLLVKEHNLGKKQDIVVELIKRLAIGVIILDEIQLIDFNSVSNSSYASLMTITNRTKVAFFVMGLQTAYDTMFSEYQYSRRLGAPISASVYCSDAEYCTQFLCKLWKYQWTKAQTQLTKKLAKAFIDESKGIAAQMVNLFAAVQDECLKTGADQMTPELVESVSKKRFAAIREHLQKLTDPIEQLALEEALRKENALQEKASDEERQRSTMTEAVERSQKNRHEALINSTVEIIESLTDYPTARIRAACDAVISDEEVLEWDAKVFRKKVMEALKVKRPKTKAPSVPSASSSDLTDKLFGPQSN